MNCEGCGGSGFMLQDRIFVNVHVEDGPEDADFVRVPCPFCEVSVEGYACSGEGDEWE